MFNYLKILAWFIIFISSLVIFGWFLGIEVFTRIIPGFVTMKFLTALSFLLSGIIFLVTLSREQNKGNLSDVIIPGATLLIFLLMGTTLLSTFFGFESGIEKLFLKENAEAILTTVPGRPSLGTMLAFIIIASLGLVSLDRPFFRRIFYQWGGGIVGLFGGVAILGYVLDQPVLYYAIVGISTAMALHTATLFLILGAGYVLLSQDKQLPKSTQFH